MIEDPKLKCCVEKPEFHFVPLRVLLGVARVFRYGAQQKGYGALNWRTSGAIGTTYYNAALRHLFAIGDEARDPESGLSHIDHAIASLMILRDIQLKITDDIKSDT